MIIVTILLIMAITLVSVSAGGTDRGGLGGELDGSMNTASALTGRK